MNWETTKVCLIVGLVLLLGALGGLMNSIKNNELSLPHINRKTKIWHLGWVGSICVGAVTALVVWGLYGPLSSLDVFKWKVENLSLTVAQLFSSFIVGYSGGNFLSTLAQKHAAQITSTALNESLENLTEK